MLSCLRIIRLLGITKGNAVRSPQRPSRPLATELLTSEPDHPAQLEEVGPASCPGVFPDRLFLVALRHYRRAELQGQLESQVRVARSVTT